MASGADFLGGPGVPIFGSADFVERHVREAEARWQGAGLVSLSAQIVLVQLLESAPMSFFQFGVRQIQLAELLGQIESQFPGFLDDMLRMTSPTEPGAASPPRVITAFELVLSFGDWLRRNCQCAPR